ncbi:MAG: sel1 repeat family protein [Gammaproteobacteria bacterium]|nr:MAG: sel1 repeat family protein [Gammaproteobacteria bacterium]
MNYFQYAWRMRKPGKNYIMAIALLCMSLLCTSLAVNADFKTAGDAYKEGDYETAAREFLPLAENGDHCAMYALGSMYAAGHGVPMDLKEALKWFRKAATYGRPDAQYKIGVMYDRGLGLKQDYRKALSWYGKSAKNGFGLAQYKIGQMYVTGHSVKQNPIKAYAWMRSAISQGIEDKDGTLAAVTSELTETQLSEANALARQYIEKYPRKY